MSSIIVILDGAEAATRFSKLGSMGSGSVFVLKGTWS